MDVEGYLRKQGWKGVGHSLDGHGRGIKKPLLITYKQDQRGLGHKKAAHKTDDQWWLRAFDDSLKGLGSGKESTLAQVQAKGINHAGLYGFFVRGKGIAGTISSTEDTETSTPASGTSTPPTSASATCVEIASNSSSSTNSESASDNEVTQTSSKDSETMVNKNKRKRGSEKATTSSKKAKSGDGPSPAVPSNNAPPEKTSTVLGEIGSDEWIKINQVLKSISFEVDRVVKANDKKGAYGPSGRSIRKTEDAKPKKAVKYAHGIALRNAKRQLTQDHVANAMIDGTIPNPENWSKDEIHQNYGKVEKAIKALTSAEKKTRKAEKQSKKEAAREAKVVAKTERLEKKRIEEATKKQDQQDAIEAHIAQLDPEKKAEYEARAAEKGQTLAEYVRRRQEKKDEKRKGKESNGEKSKTDANTSSEKKDGKSDALPDILFFEDTKGDMALAPLEWTPLEDGSCPLDPTIWKGHVVKDLPKPVREARRQWMENKRNERKGTKPGHASMTRAQERMKKTEKLVHEELKKRGFEKGASKELKNKVRLMARKTVRAERKEEKRAKKRK